jgi:hypothetical protein
MGRIISPVELKIIEASYSLSCHFVGSSRLTEARDQSADGYGETRKVALKPAWDEVLIPNSRARQKPSPGLHRPDCMVMTIELKTKPAENVDMQIIASHDRCIFVLRKGPIFSGPSISCSISNSSCLILLVSGLSILGNVLAELCRGTQHQTDEQNTFENSASDVIRLVDASRNSRVCGSHQIFSHSISNEV